MSEEPELLEITEGGEDPFGDSVMIPCGEGAVWIPDPVMFCAQYGFEALLTDEHNLYGLRANSWIRIGSAALTVVQ